MVAGVCAGLGQHLRIDPVVLRVVLAVMIFFGFTGVLLYAAGWLLIPNEGTEDSVIERHLGRRPDGAPDKAVMIGGVVVLVLLVASLPWWGFSWHPGVLLMLAVIGLFLLFRRRDGDGTPTGIGPGSDSGPSAADAGTGLESWLASRQTGAEPGTESTASADSESDAGTAPGTEERPTSEFPTVGSWRMAVPAPPSFWNQPDPLGLETEPEPAAVPPPPPPPPTPRPPRSKLFPVTAASALVVLGVLAAIDQSVADVSPAGYLAASLGVVGLGLIAGAWIGRSPGLVVSGILLTIALIPASVGEIAFDHYGASAGDRTVRPTSAAAANKGFEHGAGDFTLDLRAVRFSDKRLSTVVQAGAGEVTVILPPEVDAYVHTDVGLGGTRLFGDHEDAPVDTRNRVVDYGADGRGGGEVDLQVNLGMGEVVIRRG